MTNNAKVNSFTVLQNELTYLFTVLVKYLMFLKDVVGFIVPYLRVNSN